MNFNDIPLDAPYTLDDLDTLLDDLYKNRNLIPDTIDYFYDDCHADPETYLTSSPTFIALNEFNTATDSFYDRDAPFLLTYRMMLESIAAECADRANELASARILISNHLRPRD